MTAHDNDFVVPENTIVQLPAVEAAKWMGQQFASSTALKILHDHFLKDGYVFHLERSKVFVNASRDTKGNTVASVLGILPSFVPATAADKGHPAVGISVHDSGYALAVAVNVSHKPFGVTDFTLYEIVPGKREIIKSTISAETINEEPLDKLAGQLHPPSVPKAKAKLTKASAAAIAKFTVIDKGDQGLMIGTVVQQLLADKYSKSLFPPEYASAISLQTPTFQKFAFATSARFKGTVLGLTASTSTSTSSNICTSTSTSTIEI